MNLKKLLLIVLIICSVLITFACSRGLAGGVPGSGNIQTVTRDIGPFESISIAYSGAQITIQQGAKEAISIEADDNLLPQLSTEVESGQLTIKSTATEWKTSVSPTAQVKMVITVKDLRQIIVSAAVGDLQVSGLKADALKVILSGGAQIKMNGLQVRMLDTELSGAGSVIASGTAEEMKLLLNGMGSFEAAKLQSKKATIELSGMGAATVRTEEELSVTITGAGSVEYYGNPHVEQNVGGGGSLKPAE